MNGLTPSQPRQPGPTGQGGTKRAAAFLFGLKWPGVASFAVLWFAMSLVTWCLLCLLATLFLDAELEAGMLPVWLMLVLALAPVFAATLAAQAALLALARTRWPDSPHVGKRLVVIGILPLTWFFLWLITLLAGGVESFIVRI